jgi:chorismate dehydratase
VSDLLPSPERLRVSAVSFLNTVPLVRGLTHGPQQGVFDLRFRVPAAVADDLETGTADIGIVPCAELDRLGLSFLPDVGIACRGAVRSILLISRAAPAQIRTLAVDTSSRSSVMLARIVLAERYGAEPALVPRRPNLHDMLEVADAALIIGDPALAIDPTSLSHRVLDLGHEWLALTGLPMVFAVWAGSREVLTPHVREAFTESCLFGLREIERIAAEAPATHGVPADLARRYLTDHIRFRLGDEERRGLSLYREKVAALRGAGTAVVSC